MRRVASFVSVLALLGGVSAAPALAQNASPPAAAVQASEIPVYTGQQLDALLAPIALYPDDLIAQILMASTFPLQIVDASRWLNNPAHAHLQGDALAGAVEPLAWDPSVKSLVEVPQVLNQMDSNLDWMQQLGYAFVSQQKDVFDSIQRLRSQADAAGSLRTTTQQKVIVQAAPAGPPVIVIQSVQPNVVYVPVYNPAVVYGTWGYPAYPPVVLPPPPGVVYGTALVAGLAFGVGVAVAANSWGWAQPNWHNSNVTINHHNNMDIYNKNGNTAVYNKNTGNIWTSNNRPTPYNYNRPPTNGPVGRPAAFQSNKQALPVGSSLNSSSRALGQPTSPTNQSRSPAAAHGAQRQPSPARTAPASSPAQRPAATTSPARPAHSVKSNVAGRPYQLPAAGAQGGKRQVPANGAAQARGGLQNRAPGGGLTQRPAVGQVAGKRSGERVLPAGGLRNR